MARLDRLDEAFLIACGMIVLVALAGSFGRPSGQGSAEPLSRFEVNQSLHDVVAADFSRYSSTILLLVHSQCQFCTASMPFYRAISAAVAECSGVGLRFVSSQPLETARAYTSEHGLGDVDIISVSNGMLRGTGYPTVVVVDSSGKVTARWRGFLREDRQTQALAALGCSTGS
ncbi:MAG: hypothetical protein WEB50_15605 [Vicinamibacterales bacterium]